MGMKPKRRRLQIDITMEKESIYSVLPCTICHHLIFFFPLFSQMGDLLFFSVPLGRIIALGISNWYGDIEREAMCICVTADGFNVQSVKFNPQTTTP